MNTQGFFDARGRAVALILAALCIAAVAVLRVRHPRASHAVSDAQPTASPIAQLVSLRTSADGGDDAALRALIDALNKAQPRDVQPLIIDMLRSNRAEVRAAACAWMGKHRQVALARWVLFPRMSDQDWRVRAAAFNAVQQIAGTTPNAPRGDMPLRDTPVDQREPFILAWINAWRTAGDALPPLDDHCELYADSGGHWLTGMRLAASCFTCHAPPDRYATNDFTACAACHRQTEAEWSGSAHARSTSHLNLARVNDQTKQVERFDYGPREGLVCTTCHIPADATKDAAPAPAGTETLFVAHRFQPATSAACVACHAEKQPEWEAWRDNPRPIASRWLPGEVTWDEQPDARNCVSCHMQPHRGAGADRGVSHAWGARRDPILMRDGLAAHIEPATATRGPQLVLTNLAGHRYASGTGRRGVRIEISYDDDPATKRLLTRMTDSAVPTPQPQQAALLPSEQRRIDLPVPPGATRVTCDVTFERNHYEAGSYELALHSLSERVAAPLAPLSN